MNNDYDVSLSRRSPIAHFSSVKDSKQQDPSPLLDEEDPDSPAGIGGAEFFGGNKQKEEFYDPIAEIEAANDIQVKATTYNRFFDFEILREADKAFDTFEVAILAQSLQKQINRVLYSGDKKLNRIIEKNDPESLVDVIFGASLSWETPITLSEPPSDLSTNPLDELKAAKSFYEEIDLAIVSGKKYSDDIMELSWELSLVWPTFWSPRILLAGTSKCTLEGSSALRSAQQDMTTTRAVTITKQVDRVFGADVNSSFSLLSILGSQIAPRFWDWYHIGMTPSAEQQPRHTVAKKGGIAVYQLPPRLVTSPTIIETGTRENRQAQMVPNHSFTCIIRTMGPKKKNYVPTTPVEVRIRRNDKNNGDQLLLSWSISLSAQFQALNSNLPLPGENPEDEDGSFPTCDYKWQALRQVATTTYGGNAQDPEIPDIRKRLYERVLRDGWKPKLDQKGKPQFFFWQNDVKACYIEDGLGMCVYDWRPKFAGSNEVGIELEAET